jgi:xylulokinase
MLLLGIDVGSTSIKAVVYDESLRIVSRGQTATPLGDRESESGKTEFFWDPDQMWAGVADAVRKAVSVVENPAHIAGVAVDGFGQDAVPVARDGSWLYPFISWHDRKTLHQMEKFLQSIREEDVYHITGTRPWYFHTILRIMWLKEHYPEIVENTWKFLIITDYINYRLCGFAATDYSEASTTLLFDQTSTAWSGDLLRIAGIDRSKLPDPLQGGTRIGEVTGEAALRTGLVKGTPVVLGGHDNICSFIAARDSQNDVPVIITGTFESVLLPSRRPFLNTEGLKRNIVCEKSVVPGEYVLWGTQHAGSMVEWFDKRFGMQTGEDSVNRSEFKDRFSLLRETEVGAGGVFMLPHLLGGMTPTADPCSRGAFIGLVEETTKHELLRAIIEGVNYQSRSICEALSAVSGKDFKRVINIGGGAYSDFWMQNRADVTGMEIEVPDIREATSLGAAILAGVGTGLIGDYKEALLRRNFEVKTYTPDEKWSGRYDRYYREIFVQLYESLRELNRKICNEFS